MTELRYGDRVDVKKIQFKGTVRERKLYDVADIETIWIPATFINKDDGSVSVMYENGDREVIQRGHWRPGFKQDAHR